MPSTSTRAASRHQTAHLPADKVQLSNQSKQAASKEGAKEHSTLQHSRQEALLSTVPGQTQHARTRQLQPGHRCGAHLQVHGQQEAPTNS